jgi:hypothetical protein
LTKFCRYAILIIDNEKLAIGVNPGQNELYNKIRQIKDFLGRESPKAYLLRL